LASAVRVRQDRDDGAQRPARDETYAWLGNLPTMREWIGPRVAGNLLAYGFTIANRKFESTVSVAREDIEDDRLGTFKPAFAEMGSMARRHPDELVFGLLKNGFNSPWLMTGSSSLTPTIRSSAKTAKPSPRLPTATAGPARPGSFWTCRARSARSSGPGTGEV
jgi:hypothetical protein